ncbi:MAG TPA: isochorismate synthase [Candidatus Hydrogenedentes bacterium]|nr:isochorismate synthase [Candidatus Hydrogenedentota bacterium]
MSEKSDQSEAALSLEAAIRRAGARAVEALTGASAAPATVRRLARVQVPIGEVAALDWLRAQAHLTQYYWADRDNAFEMAGVGEADVVAPGQGDFAGGDVFAFMRERLSPEVRGQRYYGGFRFHPGPPRGERWRAFHDFRFVVPRFEVVRRGKRYDFACNVLLGDGAANRRTLDAVVEMLESLRQPVRMARLPFPPVTARSDAPDRACWEATVYAALEAFRTTPLEKVVLARETVFETEGPLDPVAVLARLVEYTEQSFDFCFHPAPDRAFIGASPELLYRRSQCFLESEAVAGTRPRGHTDAEDALLGEVLLTDDKSRREHAYVVKMLRKTFKGLCRSVRFDEKPSLLRLRNVQHLKARIEGLIEGPEDDAALIRALHPTPAVGGTPRAAALRWIEEYEPFDRGIYASPVGWVAAVGAEFCVGIRSGLVQGNTLALYNGAGIVAGSDPAEEWMELEHKMGNFLKVLFDYA